MYKCKKCNYEWTSRVEKPLACPRCKNRDYDKPRKKQKTRCQQKKERNIKRNANPSLRLNSNISGLIRYSLKGNKGGKHWESLVGYTLKQLKKHLERQFVSGMTWDNYGGDGWWIDHKIPVSVFNFTKLGHRDFKRCWALSNLQPMWAEDNRSKRAKLTKHFQPSLLL